MKRNSATFFDSTILCWVLYSRGVQLYGQWVVEVCVLLKNILPEISFMFTSLTINMEHNSLELWVRIIFLEIFMGPMAVSGFQPVLIFQGAFQPTHWCNPRRLKKLANNEMKLPISSKCKSTFRKTFDKRWPDGLDWISQNDTKKPCKNKDVDVLKMILSP